MTLQKAAEVLVHLVRMANEDLDGDCELELMEVIEAFAQADAELERLRKLVREPA